MGIITDHGYLKHSMPDRFEFGEMLATTDVNYFELMEDGLLAWDNVAYESVSNNRCSPKNF